MHTDGELIRKFSQGGGEADDAFALLVGRHLPLVYSTALRMLHGDADRAKDVAQMVFANLARRLPELPETVVLGGWLYRDTCFQTLELLRAERRRTARETRALEAVETASPGPDWDEVRPVIDNAMAELDEADRSAVVLRYFENHSLADVGRSLGLSESGASRRVGGALERLRRILSRHGITTTAAALGATLSARAVETPPPELANAIAVATPAGAVGASAGGGVAPALTTASHIALVTMKTKTIVVAVVAVLLLLGIGGHLAIRELHESIGRRRGMERAAVEEQRRAIARAMPLVTRLIGHAGDHGGRLPAALAELGLDGSEFQLTGPGPIPSSPGEPPIVILREIASWTNVFGQECRVIGYSDGHAVVVKRGETGFAP